MKKREYVLSVPLHVKHMRTQADMNRTGFSTQPETVQKYDIRIVGAGNDGKLSMKPSLIDFGTVTVGFTKVLSFTVYNNSKTSIYMEFKLEQQGIDEDDHAGLERVNEIVNSNFKL